jgi:hypothetical protein
MRVAVAESAGIGLHVVVVELTAEFVGLDIG